MKYLKGEANGEAGGGGRDAQATRLVKVVFWFGHYRLPGAHNPETADCCK